MFKGCRREKTIKKKSEKNPIRKEGRKIVANGYQGND